MIMPMSSIAIVITVKAIVLTLCGVYKARSELLTSSKEKRHANSTPDPTVKPIPVHNKVRASGLGGGEVVNLRKSRSGIWVK